MSRFGTHPDLFAACGRHGARAEYYGTLTAVTDICRHRELSVDDQLVRCWSSGLPDLPPGCEFRGTDSITGEIAFVQADEFGLDDFGEMLAVAGVNFFLRPSRYSCCDVLSGRPLPGADRSLPR
jgi:hypothetical protein